MEKYTDHLWDYIRGYPGLRFGQACMNALYELHPDVYEEITNTESDTFYTKDPETITKFFEEVKTYIGE